MKLVLFQTGEAASSPGLLTDRGVIDISAVAATQLYAAAGDGRHHRRFRSLAARLGKARTRSNRPAPVVGSSARAAAGTAQDSRCAANYWEHAQRAPRPLNMFMKNPDAVIGPGDTIQLPAYTDPWIFMHEAELALVMKGPSKMIKRENWRDAVFGYTCFIDVTARGEGRQTWPATLPMSWLGKSFDTFAPLGPCIVTVDEIANPNDLHVRFWNDGQLRHNYNSDDMEHHVPELVEFATTVMTLRSGDLIACGTNHEGLGALQDGEIVEIEIQGIGRMSLKVADPLKRTWERGIYMGADSTHPEAVRRHRPRDAGTSVCQVETQAP